MISSFYLAEAGDGFALDPSAPWPACRWWLPAPAPAPTPPAPGAVDRNVLALFGLRESEAHRQESRRRYWACGRGKESGD